MRNNRNYLNDFINKHPECRDIQIDSFNDDEITFYCQCLDYSISSQPEVVASVENNDWRNTVSTEYGKEYGEGKYSVTPLSRHDIFIILLNWGKALHDIILGGAPAKPTLVFSVAKDIPVLFSHVKFLHTKEEQCVYFQISLLSSNSPKNAVTFDDLVSYDFSILGAFNCPYSPEKCLFLENTDLGCKCKKHLSSGDFNDPLLGVLEQMEQNGIIRFNRITRSINII